METDLEFRVDTASLLQEVTNCAMPRSMGVLKIPLNIFRLLLIRVAERAIDINDPELNILMLKLNLYEMKPQEIMEAIKNQRKLIKK